MVDSVARPRPADGTAAGGGPTSSGIDPKWWTLAAVCTGVFMLLLDVTIVNVALPDIQRDLDVRQISQVQWVIDAYALSLAALLLTAGSLADIYGRRRIFAIGLVVFTVGSILCGVAPNVTFLSIARAGQGIGGAAMFATALALLASAFTGSDRGTAFAAFGATTGVSVAVGPVLGGFLTTASWRWIFFVNLPICLVALFITLRRVQESHDPRAGRPDWIGFITFSGALGALVYGLIEAGQHSWGETRVVACLVAAVVLLALFVVSQLRQEHPMFDLGLLRKPTFTGGLLAAFALSGSVFALFTYLVLYLQGVLGYSPAKAGLIFLSLSGASFVAAIVAGRLTEHVPIRLLIAPGFVLCSVGLFLQLGISHAVDKGEWTHLVPGLLISGFGVGMINPPLASTAVGVVRPAQSGMASGVNSTFRQVGIATGTAALGSILAQQVGDDVESKLAGKVPDAAIGGLSEALSSGQAQLAADQAGQAGGAQAHDAVLSVGAAAYIDALNHIILIGAIACAVAAVLTFFLIRQKDFVARGGPQEGAAPGAADGKPSDPGASSERTAEPVAVGAAQSTGTSTGTATGSATGSAPGTAPGTAPGSTSGSGDAVSGRHVDPDAEPDSGPGPDPDAHHNVGPSGGAHESGAHLGDPPVDPR